MSRRSDSAESPSSSQRGFGRPLKTSNSTIIRGRSVDHHGATRVEVVAEVGVSAPVAGLGIHDHDVAVVDVAGGGLAGLVSPEATALVAVPVVVPTGIDHQGHEP